MLMRALLFCGLLTAATPAMCMTLYKSTDANGVVFFSDQPSPGAQAFLIQERTPARAQRPVPGVPQTRYAQRAYRYPVPWRGGPFRLSQGPNGSFSHTDAKSRYALDIAMPEGTQVIAARSGRVMKTENDQAGHGGDASGNFVRVQHDDGTEGVYLHLKQGSVSVRVGQRVAAGSPLALSGNTGNSSGPHLHFVVQRATEAGLVSIPYEFNQPVGTLPNFALGN
ncbi:peptidoglycan DD-metalloendopeptidase family protein [Pseudomonas kitaguniensis]|uniref:peptidoglycan DD-metalloendopeptidase family protein n=1 Tax=Pseudomonas kitaguniensis TaxID=2607908 RepID=UPI003CFEDAF5